MNKKARLRESYYRRDLYLIVITVVNISARRTRTYSRPSPGCFLHPIQTFFQWFKGTFYSRNTIDCVKELRYMFLIPTLHTILSTWSAAWWITATHLRNLVPLVDLISIMTDTFDMNIICIYQMFRSCKINSCYKLGTVRYSHMGIINFLNPYW